MLLYLGEGFIMARKQYNYLFVLLALVILAGLCLSGTPSLAQNAATANMLCVKAPPTIAKGDTETLEAAIITAGTALPATEDGWECKVTEVFPVMGVGLGGVRATTFETDPVEERVSQTFDPTLNNEWVWFLNAIGEVGTNHTLSVYSYINIDDPDIRATYRTFTRIFVKIEIIEEKTTMEQVGDLLREFRDLIVLASAVVVALIALRGQISNLMGRGKKAEESQK